ncbi:DNA-directed DNA polymerase [Senna tora]|uniref:DNA-directed DNA polymerase n=1 Tax=Senna tora TaxID=362788 RepID=A0A834XBK2_9FABA|nr:DNA-directed DNA polymerase [Senna tora]
MAEQNNRNVFDYATPKLDGLKHSIRRPSIQAYNFEIKPATIQLLQANGQFGGSPIEDPNNHILNFLEISGGALMFKPVDAAYTLLETMSSNNHQWHSDRNVHARVARVQDYDIFASLSSQIATLTKEVKSLGIQRPVKSMADRSIAYPRGIIENVLVKVDKLILPANFIVLDYEEDKNVQIILDRPFLATGRTIIDVQKGELTMRVQDQEVKFNMFKAMKLPGETEECFHVNVVDNVVDCLVQDDELKYHPIDPSEVFKYPYAETCDVDFVGCAKILEAPPWKIRAPPWANVVAKQGPNAQRAKLPGFKETQWSIKRRIRMAISRRKLNTSQLVMVLLTKNSENLCQINYSKSRAHGIEGAGVKLEATGANLEPLD